MLLIVPALSGQKQKLDVIGVVVDTQNMPLVNATVIVIRAVDTSMLNYGLTNTEGKFKILNLDTGKLIMQINFLGFDQVSIPIDQDGQEKEKDIGTIEMEKRSKLLDEIIVTAPFIPIQLKDDTIEYNAEAFKVEDNVIVEKLLKKLPGIEINRDGTIKSNGA